MRELNIENKIKCLKNKQTTNNKNKNSAEYHLRVLLRPVHTFGETDITIGDKKLILSLLKFPRTFETKVIFKAFFIHILEKMCVHMPMFCITFLES